jgi:autophagy-related protein 16
VQHSNPVRVAYVASLETQISSLRDELANLYKTQGQNAQRLLSMNETLREKEELSRIDSENLRKVKDEIAALRVKVGQHAELMVEKDRTIQVNQAQPLFISELTFKLLIEILHDEISTALLELGQVEDRNQTLTKDNAKLLQRWLDAKQVEANRMNEANEFYENMRSKHDTVLSWREGSAALSWREGSGPDAVGSAPTSDPNLPLSGKGLGDHQAMGAMTKNGLLSPTSKAVDLTPNG